MPRTFNPQDKKQKGLLLIEWVKMRVKSLRTHDLRGFLACSSI